MVKAMPLISAYKPWAYITSFKLLLDGLKTEGLISEGAHNRKIKKTVSKRAIAARSDRKSFFI